ncbi:MAG: hypothetical protein JWM68_500 [Verrucomicrobiales bacterium]|nr:hypothetical protein [Verrucomicrobiales bacterium]
MFVAESRQQFPQIFLGALDGGIKFQIVKAARPFRPDSPDVCFSNGIRVKLARVYGLLRQL